MRLQKIFNLRLISGMSVLAIVLCAYWYWFSYERFLNSPLNINDSEITLVIKKGSGINRLTKQWKEQGLITTPFYLKLFCWLNPKFKNIKAGEYLLKKNDTPLSLLNIIYQGKVIQYAVTIVEGVNRFDLFKYLSKQPNLNNDIDSQLSSLKQVLDIPTEEIEGWLFPDTYYYAKGSSLLELLKRASQKMQKTLQEEWESRAQNLPYQSKYEALIMASIIEKETGVASERKKIAGVFVNRLQKKMRLQTDPTVIYGIGPSFNGDITYKNLRTKTPYNTYVIKGLPPTPIAMPGRASIHAALHPEETDAFYFVANGRGGHHFSSTLQEHNAAVRRYQLNQ